MEWRFSGEGEGVEKERRAVPPPPSTSSTHRLHQLIHTDYYIGRIGCCLCSSSTKMFMKITSNVVINCVFWNIIRTRFYRETLLQQHTIILYLRLRTYLFVSNAIFCCSFSLNSAVLVFVFLCLTVFIHPFDARLFK